MPKWCCERFDREIEHEKHKGFSIIAHCEGSLLCFILMACPFEKEVSDGLEKKDPTTGLVMCPEIKDRNGILIPIVTAMYLPLSFCPHCGADLSKMIEKEKVRFLTLAKRHSDYLRK